MQVALAIPIAQRQESFHNKNTSMHHHHPLLSSTCSFDNIANTPPSDPFDFNMHIPNNTGQHSKPFVMLSKVYSFGWCLCVGDAVMLLRAAVSELFLGEDS